MREIKRSEFYFNFSDEERKNFTGTLVERDSTGKILLKEYWVNGKKHRDDGPAVISVKGDNNLYHDYYINGKLVKYDAFLLYQDMLKLKGLL